MIWENGSAHVIEGGREQTGKEKSQEQSQNLNSTAKSAADAEQPQHSLNTEGKQEEQGLADSENIGADDIDINSTVKTSSPEQSPKDADPSMGNEAEPESELLDEEKPELSESEFADPTNHTADGISDQNMPDIQPAILNEKTMLNSVPAQAAAAEPTNVGGSLADFLPGIKPPEDPADSAESIEGEPANLACIPFGSMPAVLALENADKQPEQKEQGQAAQIRNLDLAAAEFAERRALVDDVLNLNSPALSESESDGEQADPALQQSKIA